MNRVAARGAEVPLPPVLESQSLHYKRLILQSLHFRHFTSKLLFIKELVSRVLAGQVPFGSDLVFLV